MTARDYACDECQELDWLESEAWSHVHLCLPDDYEGQTEAVLAAQEVAARFRAHRESDECRFPPRNAFRLRREPE